jgi:aspartyl-tRNA synthetase
MILRSKVLPDKAWYLKGLAWVAWIALFCGVLFLTWPPVKSVTAVDLKNASYTEPVQVSGGDIRGICVPGGASLYSRKKIDKLVTEVKHYGAKGLVWIKAEESGISSSIGKFFSEDELKSVLEKCGANAGDIVFIVSGTSKVTYDSLGFLRRKAAGDLGLLDDDQFNFLWVVDFPMFEEDEEGNIKAMHHPFTQPKLEELDKLDNDILDLKANAYDIVLNGYELGGGSIRIHSSDVQNRMFEALGLSEQDIKSRFGFLVDAFKYGAPPHGGFAIGMDRLIMLLCGTDNIKDVIAFPKMQNAKCLMTNAPDFVDDVQLEELKIKIVEN